MKRGDIVLCAGKGPYASKPRPAVVIQTDEVDPTFPSVTLCPITSCVVDNADSFRIKLHPGKLNQLQKISFVMIDKISTYPRNQIHPIQGKISFAMLQKINAALLNWLSL